MKTGRLGWILLVAAIAVSGLVLGACGGDDDDDDDSAGGGSGNVTCDGDTCVIQGVILDDLTLTADTQWILRGGVFIGNDGDETVLTIEPGTTVYGETSTSGMLVIARGSKILAEGTADAPIVFTSSKAEGSRARGDWGGLIVNGRAPVNNCLTDEESFCESIGEGNTGTFGGTDAADDSGVLMYVRVEFAGRLISPDNELNGIAFQGVGSGTTVDYVQVHQNKDDGVEFFGGAAQAKHIVVTGVADDMLDWTDGWQGKVQFAVLQQWADAGDNGIEADNNAEDNGASPRSHPTISNVTVIGSGGDDSDLGALLREGTAGNLSNVILTGWGEACLALDHLETFENAWGGEDLSGELTMTNSIIDCTTEYEEPDTGEWDAAPPFTVEEFFTTLNADNQIADPMIVDPASEAAPDFTLDAGSPALSGASVPGDSFFDDVDYIGGMGNDDWTAGWTTSAAN